MTPIELQARLKQFAYRIVIICESLPQKKFATSSKTSCCVRLFQRQQIIEQLAKLSQQNPLLQSLASLLKKWMNHCFGWRLLPN